MLRLSESPHMRIYEFEMSLLMSLCTEVVPVIRVQSPIASRRPTGVYVIFLEHPRDASIGRQAEFISQLTTNETTCKNLVSISG